MGTAELEDFFRARRRKHRLIALAFAVGILGGFGYLIARCVSPRSFQNRATFSAQQKAEIEGHIEAATAALPDRIAKMERAVLDTRATSQRCQTHIPVPVADGDNMMNWRMQNGAPLLISLPMDADVIRETLGKSLRESLKQSSKTVRRQMNSSLLVPDGSKRAGLGGPEITANYIRDVPRILRRSGRTAFLRVEEWRDPRIGSGDSYTKGRVKAWAVLYDYGRQRALCVGQIDVESSDNLVITVDVRAEMAGSDSGRQNAQLRWDLDRNIYRALSTVLFETEATR